MCFFMPYCSGHPILCPVLLCLLLCDLNPSDKVPPAAVAFWVSVCHPEHCIWQDCQGLTMDSQHAGFGIKREDKETFLGVQGPHRRDEQSPLPPPTESVPWSEVVGFTPDSSCWI